MTAAKMMDVTTTRMRRTSSICSISLHPSQNGRCTIILKNFQSQNVQIFGYVYQNTNGQNDGPALKTQSFLQSEICTVIHVLAGPLWERPFEKVILENGWKKVPNWEFFFVNREKGLFLSVYVDDIKKSGKKQNLDPMWNIHVYLGCTQRECQTSKDIVDNYRNMFES